MSYGPDRYSCVGFAGAEDRWISRLGQLRDIVRQELIAAQLREVVSERQRVLDVGCGQGTQALILARSGHEVTGLDPSDYLLTQFEETLAEEPNEVRERVHLVRGAGEAAPELTPGPFDVVLCHGVLMYLDNDREMLSALSQVSTDEAVLSLLVRNGLAPAMRPGLLRQWDEAAAAFEWYLDQWFGVRVLTDHLEEDPPPALELARIVAVEQEAGRRDPYRQVAAFLHLIYRRHP
jgi:S-adenosylmethionine-dependent methyltransferase